MNHKRLFLPMLVALLALAPLSQAQWLSQSFDLKAGWNAVFLHVDASHTDLNAMIGSVSTNLNPIQEIYRWNPPSVAQFVESLTELTAPPEWTSWNRTNESSALKRLVGDSAYLVRVGSNLAPYRWTVQGRPVAPRHAWTISGLNLIGFPTVTNTPPRFGAFLAQAPELQSATPEIYYYPGGDLGSNNPALLASMLFNHTNGTVQRGQAFWMRSGTVFNRYFGPFEVVQAGGNGVDFRDTSSTATFRLRNLSTVSNLTVTLRLGESETAPPGQSNIVAVPPLLLRGSLILSNLTYGYTNLPVNSPHTWTLAPRDQPGSEVEVVLGLNRSAITAAPGELLAGILSFTDSLGFTLVQLPVSATAASSAGLWVGGAAVTQVSQYLKSFAYGAVTNYVPLPTGTNYVAPSVTNSLQTINTNALLSSSNGSYIVTTNNTELAGVPRAYPLRLIVQNPEAGHAVLLQRVYVGFDPATNLVVASGQSALHPGHLKDARRISATHLPRTATNTVWPFDGNLGLQTNLVTTVTLGHDDQASNPFLHTYHPDHDNLDVTFKKELPPGSESYTVVRAITLRVQPPANDFSSLVAGAQSLTGQYLETITLQGLGGSAREYRVSGVFTLHRISPVPTLTLAP